MNNSSLQWSNGLGRASYADIMIDIYEKPKLPFEYDSIFYESDTDMKLIIKDNIQSELTEEGCALCNSCAEDIIGNADYMVHSISEDNVYAGPKLKSEVLTSNTPLDYTLIAPDHPASKWVDNEWQRVVAVIMDNGQLIEMPASICQLCLLHFTEKEWENHPKPDTPHETWDFKKEKWVDIRKLDEVKKECKTLIRHVFDSMRVVYLETLPSELERSTWKIQEDEAKAYIENNEVETPFLDIILHNRKVNKIDLCHEIINNALIARNRLAIAHYGQWKWFDKVDECNTVSEVDSLTYEFSTTNLSFEVLSLEIEGR